MHVLFLDFIYPIEHRQFNQNMVKAISQFSNVTILSPKDYFGSSFNEFSNINIIEDEKMTIRKGKFLFRLSSLKFIQKSSKLARKIKPNIVFVSCFETLSFSLARFFFRSLKNVYVVHHNNTDELSNKIKRIFFKSYMNSVNHIVSEDFIKDYLINTINVNPENIHVVPHPISKFRHINKNTIQEEKITCLGISNSNDESFIEKIINLEKQSNIFAKYDLKLVLRSRLKEFDNGNLKVIRGYLDKKDYDNYYNSCESVLVPLNKSFRYRMSGTLLDAISNGKVVLGSNVELINHYSRRYPSICKKYDSPEELIKTLKSLPSESKNIEFEISMFKERHSIQNTAELLYEFMDGK